MYVAIQYKRVFDIRVTPDESEYPLSCGLIFAATTESAVICTVPLVAPGAHVPTPVVATNSPYPKGVVGKSRGCACYPKDLVGDRGIKSSGTSRYSDCLDGVRTAD